MTKPQTRPLLAAAIGLGLVRVAAAQLDPNLTPREFKCEVAVNKAGGKYLKALSKCESKCQKGFTEGLNPVTDCYPPYGGAMAACEAGPTKGADAKFRAAIAKACDPATNPRAECPECYDAAVGSAGCGDPGYAGDHQQLALNFFDTVTPSMFCKTAGASNAEQKCQVTTTKVAAKLLASILKCFGKCFHRANEGQIPGADCKPNPVLPADLATQGCIATADSKSILGFDKRCATAGVAIQCPTPCNTNVGCDSAPMAGDGICTNRNCTAGNTSTSAYFSGAEWTNLLTNAIAGDIVDSVLGPDTGTFCSP